MALEEALVNAAEHGNLELDSALRSSDRKAYVDLANQRRGAEPYRDRRVYVEAHLSRQEARFIVRDEGAGFDPGTLPDPRDPENLLKVSGRGVLIMRTFMDHVSFNPTGNEVTLVKLCAQAAGRELAGRPAPTEPVAPAGPYYQRQWAKIDSSVYYLRLGTCPSMARRMSMARRLVVLLLVSLLTGIALADSPQTGTIDGVVVDASGTALPGVNVTLASDRGDKSTVTDESGKFIFGLLPPGQYTLKASLEGFQPTEQAVPLETGQRQTLDLRLGLGTSEEIAVIAEAPLVDKYQVSASTTLEAGVAKELVFTNRNYQSLITSLPGVVHSDQSTQLAEIMPSVNGNLWQENAAFVDGVDTTNTRYGGGSRMILPTSALAEVRSDASGYGAEYGRVVGGVTGVVTKSGTNAFHGDFQYIAQNQKWEAQSDDVPLPREDDIINSYEASVGGPIFRDKAWFFAAAADNDTNQISSLAGGDLIQNSVTSESYIGKINFNPTVRHSLVGTYIDAPAVVPFFATIYGDLPTVSEHDLGGSFATAAWTFTAATNLFLEVRAADQDSSESRTLITRTEIVPGASPDDPAGNQSAYWDNTTGLRWHSSALPLGPGVLEFPRQQGNVAATWFLSQNELKFGVDYQDVEWESLNQVPDRYMGRGYNPSLPGGFITPLTKNVYRAIDTPVKTASTNLAGYAADRLEIGERLTLNLGVRYEDQQHENDLGEEVLASEDFTPRLAAIYDFGGNGKLLAKATAGRYLTHITQEFINAEFSTLPNGANSFDQFSWNPATRRYDIFVRTQLPPAGTRQVDVEPYFKDEATAGFEWQMTPKWALDVRGIWWKVEEPYSGTDQFNAAGQVFRLLTNFEDAEREYQGLPGRGQSRFP